MSQFYNVGSRVVWNPGMNTSQLFLRQVRALERALPFVEAPGPCGLHPRRDDTIEVDPTLFGPFVARWLRDLEKYAHAPVFQELAHGPVAVMVGLLHAITGEWPAVGPEVQPVIERARALRICAPSPPRRTT